MKNTFLFVLSKEHSTLPLAELEAVLAMESDFELLCMKENFAVYKTSRSGSRFLDMLSRRLVMTHSICRLMGSCYMEEMERFLRTLPKFKLPCRVRVHLYDKGERTETLEREIGGMVSAMFESSGRKSIDLEHPRTSLEFFISGREVYCGVLLCPISKKHFCARKPEERPFLRPVSADPRMARLLVNLSRTGRGRMLDPFCGTGSIPIEAGTVGLRVYGTDIDRKMVEGCRKNLEHFGINGDVREGDARSLESIFGRNFFDCIVTDPPYGRLSSTKGSDTAKLYEQSMESMERVLKPGHFLVITAPTNININTKMKLIEIHKQRINRSLERNIMVYRK